MVAPSDIARCVLRSFFAGPPIYRRLLQALPLLAETPRPKRLLEHLSPLNQLRAIVGLFAVVVLGIVILIVIKAGAHMAKGFSAAADRLSHKSLPDDDDWTRRPLQDPQHDHD